MGEKIPDFRIDFKNTHRRNLLMKPAASLSLSFLFRILGIALLLILSYFSGQGAARVYDSAYLPASGSASVSWGLGFGEPGTQPTGNASAAVLREYDAYYIEETAEKRIYLTFDCGFENGNTPAILDALKKHNAPATFFVVGNYLETSPDLVKRMLAEGHAVGNHTYHHPDMSGISTKEDFAEELQSLENLYTQVTGQTISKYYRPPRGIYSERNLRMAQELGYQTFFWSLAYVDWKQDDQPTHQEAFDKLLSRIHPGAIVLLHNTSQTNAEILDELLTKWEEMGYTFRPLSELCGV